MPALHQRLQAFDQLRAVATAAGQPELLQLARVVLLRPLIAQRGLTPWNVLREFQLAT